jgi:hypothetical protein
MNPTPQARSRRLLIGMALVFFLPLLASFALYYSGAWRPHGHVNQGELIEPARPLPPVALPLQAGGSTRQSWLDGKWTFLMTESGPCEAACLQRLYDTRQVRLALDREMNRVQRVLIADEHCCDFTALREMHPDLLIVLRTAAAEPLLRVLPDGEAHRVFLTDPLGNLMMFYPPQTPSKGMLKDMKRLLNLSQIG